VKTDLTIFLNPYRFKLSGIYCISQYFYIPKHEELAE